MRSNSSSEATPKAQLFVLHYGTMADVFFWRFGAAPDHQNCLVMPKQLLQSCVGSSFLIFLLELSEVVRSGVRSGQKWSEAAKQAMECDDFVLVVVSR